MALEIVESFFSRSGTEGDQATAELIYFVHGTGDDLQVRDLVLANVPILYDLLIIDDFRIEPIGVQWWKATIPYKQIEPENKKDPSQKKPGDRAVLQFDTTGGTANQKYAFSQTAAYRTKQIEGEEPADTEAPDYGGAVGVKKDGTVEGVEVIVPKLEWTETHYLHGKYISFTYLNLLYRLTGKVNSDPFRAFNPGEVLFMGAQGREVAGTGTGELTYHFAASPNVELTLPGIEDPIRKDGWDYLWFDFKTSLDEKAKKIVTRADWAFVERVYERVKFAQLQFGPLPEPGADAGRTPGDWRSHGRRRNFLEYSRDIPGTEPRSF